MTSKEFFMGMFYTVRWTCKGCEAMLATTSKSYPPVCNNGCDMGWNYTVMSVDGSTEKGEV